MNALSQDQLLIIVLGLALLVIILFIMSIVQAVKVKKLRRQYVQFMDQTGVEGLEHIIIDLRNEIEDLKDGRNAHQEEINQVKARMRKMTSNVGILRYSPFEGQGSDLSFSMALVNDEQDGIVISGLHSRENTYVYAKPLEQGQSKYPLSPEEIEAVSQASRKA